MQAFRKVSIPMVILVLSASVSAQPAGECVDEEGEPLPPGSCATNLRYVVECREPDGTTSFRDSCPPGMAQTNERRLYVVGLNEGPTMQQAAAKAPITLFTAPQCDACDLTRNALNSRSIPFTEIDVQDNAAAQEDMRAKTGTLTVPTALIGGKSVSGYNRDALDIALAGAGYPVEPDVKAQAAPAPETEDESE